MANTNEPWAYGIVRHGKCIASESSRAVALHWLNAEIVPLVPEEQIRELKAKISTMENHAAIGRAIYRACEYLPEGYDLHIECERGASGVRLHLCGTDEDINYFGDDVTLAQEIDNAINVAISHAEKGGAA